MISIIVPFYNEKENIPILYKKLQQVLKEKDYEIIFVDDGSTDGFVLEINNKNTTVIKHRKRFGKGTALKTGIAKASGNIIVFMDADLQDDPSDLHVFLSKIDEGYDLVNGWRKIRKDELIKTLPSKIGNTFFLRHILQSKFHDVNCGYKAMRRVVIDEITLYGDNFRFLPVLAEKKGFKTTEVVVEHHSRQFGKSKFGFIRRFTVFADIITSYFIFRFSEKPLHFFGIVGGTFFGTGFSIALYLTLDRVVYGHLLYRRPALLFSVLLIIVGIQIIMTGIVAELLVYLDKKAEIR